MSLQKIRQVSGKTLYLPLDDVDTDRIIPARFMKCVTFDGLGEYAFYDARHDADGKAKEHPFNSNPDGSILLAGRNFGCGSSREHAPQALYHWGIRGIIAKSFAEIFFGNCSTLGIPCITYEDIDQLAELSADGSELAIDIQHKQLKIAGKSFAFELAEEIRAGFLQGEWDPLSTLLENKEEILTLHSKLPCPQGR